jgi:hypothetical protein
MIKFGYPRGGMGAICNNQHFDLSDLALLTGSVELLCFLQLACDVMLRL